MQIIDSTVYKKDSRKLNEILNTEIIDVTITSPPYFDLKDYGSDKQIGYGQTYDKYLEDLKIVFTNVYNCTKPTGTLWVIIDSFRKNGEVTPLPFDFSNKIKDIGWQLQDIIIWAKDKTVPWAHKGQMRNLFEYILVFSKTNKYNFYIDEIRDYEILKKWWVKYPERYNPNGKTPEGIWQFDIPTQGSWGNGYIRHFCPLPEDMIEQILKLTTKEGDIVLDPFAGSGAVLAKANFMNRKYLGFELNGEYIQMFKKYLKDKEKDKINEYEKREKNTIPRNKFRKLNLDLRALKFARILFKNLSEIERKNIHRIYVETTNKKVSRKNAWCVVKYIIACNAKTDCSKLLSSIEEKVSKPPLSKFGIEAEFDCVQDLQIFLSKVDNQKRLYSYTNKITHKFKNELTHQNIESLNSTEIIISKIKVDLTESDYE